MQILNVQTNDVCYLEHLSSQLTYTFVHLVCNSFTLTVKILLIKDQIKLLPFVLMLSLLT